MVSGSDDGNGDDNDRMDGGSGDVDYGYDHGDNTCS